MPAPDNPQQLYEQLAMQCQRRKESQQRDVFLVLAADSALAHGDANEAERLRRQLLELSPYTLLRPFVSFAEALQSDDIREYVADLRQQYPPEVAAEMLEPASHASLLPTDLFDGSTETDIIFPLPASLSAFENHEPTVVAAPSRASSPPSIHLPATTPSIHIPSPPSPPPPSDPAKKPRRRSSPYENPDYGPRVPADARPKQDFLGTWVIYVLVAVVALMAVGTLAYVFIRPFVIR